MCNTKNVELVRSLGADEVIDYEQERLHEERQDLRRHPRRGRQALVPTVQALAEARRDLRHDRPRVHVARAAADAADALDRRQALDDRRSRATGRRTSCSSRSSSRRGSTGRSSIGATRSRTSSRRRGTSRPGRRRATSCSSSARDGAGRPDVGRRRRHGDEPEPLEDRPAVRRRVDLDEAEAALAREIRAVGDGRPVDAAAAPRRQRAAAPERREVGSALEADPGGADDLGAGLGDDDADRVRVGGALLLEALREPSRGCRRPRPPPPSPRCGRSRRARRPRAATRRREAAARRRSRPPARSRPSRPPRATKPAARNRSGRSAGRSCPCSFHSKRSPALGEHAHLPRDQLIELAPVEPAEVAVADEAAAGSKPRNRTSGPSRSTWTPPAAARARGREAARRTRPGAGDSVTRGL